MPLEVLTCPIQSRNKSPKQAPLPSALQGRFQPPPVQTSFIEVIKRVQGLSSYEAYGEAGIIDDTFSQSPTGSYPLQAAAREYLQKTYKIYGSQIVSTTDGRQQSSSLEGPGNCPVTSGDFPDANWGDSLPTLTGGDQPKRTGADVDGDESAHYSNGTSQMADAISVASLFAMIESKIGSVPFLPFSPAGRVNNVGYWDEAPDYSRHLAIGGLQPGQFTGNFIITGGGSGTFNVPNNSVVSSGWFLGGQHPGRMSRWRGRLFLPPNLPSVRYCIIHIRQAYVTATISGGPRTQTFLRADTISTGQMHPGQVIGGDILLPDPATPGFFDVIGPDGNPVFQDYYLAAFGSPAGYLRALGLVEGDNNIVL